MADKDEQVSVPDEVENETESQTEANVVNESDEALLDTTNVDESNVEEDSKLMDAEDDSKAEDVLEAADGAVEVSVNLGEGDEVAFVDEDLDDNEDAEAGGDESKAEGEEVGKEEGGKEEEEEDEEEHEDEEEEAAAKERKNADPNVMPQVNVAVLAKRLWQVKVYPLKPGDFSSGQISRVFNKAKESLLYILNGRYARGKGEMYTSSINQTVKVVQNLMKLDFQYPEINIEVIRKNEEGVIEEKAYMRFDTKLVRMLCVILPPPRRVGSKRERVIGSIFVKNLPNSTSKDMLRVMFPFAPEINYNPEKYKDGTARLVLNNRSAVVPCLKAFAKIELGGNVLELHPLEKRKRLRDAGDKSAAKQHDRASSEKHRTDEAKKEHTSKVDEESKPRESKSEDKETPKSVSKEDGKPPAARKPVAPKKGPGANRFNDFKKGSGNRVQDIRNRARMMNRGRAAHSGGGLDRRRSGGADRRDSRRPGNKAKDLGGRDKNPRGFDDPMRRNRRTRRNWREGGAGGGRARLGSSGGFGHTNRGFDERGMRNFGGAGGEMGLNTEATKEMMVLQSQLSMAIKNQLTMLNQTQLAVEQAKRGAGGVLPSGSGAGYSKRMSDVASLEHARRGPADSGRDRRFGSPGRSRDRGLDVDDFGMGGAGLSYKRSSEMAGLQNEFGGSGFGKRRNAQGASLWAEDRAGSSYGGQQPFGYGMDAEAEGRGDDMGGYARGFGAGDMNYGYQY